MLVANQFLEKVGLMAEDYFLFFEEWDWVMSGKNVFRQIYAPKSLIYHKAGASVKNIPGEKPFEKAMFYLQKNRIRFFARFKPFLLPWLFLNIAVEFLKLLWEKEYSLAYSVTKGVKGAFEK